MDLLNFWKLKKIPVPTRCTYCDYEDLFSEREIRKIQKITKMILNATSRLSVKFVIMATKSLLNTLIKQGKLYLYDPINVKITNPDPEKRMQRIYAIK